MKPERFNLRVYGLCINPLGQVLVTDELRMGVPMTKFPGGGLEHGEGTKACLIREFEEELGHLPNVLGLYYLNDFFQPSRFNPKDEILSIYYLVTLPDWESLPISNLKPVWNADQKGEMQSFRWLDCSELEESDFTFPIDRVVVKKLKQDWEALLHLVS